MPSKDQATSPVYLSPTMAVLLGLGFASGLPYQLTQETLSGWLAASKVDVTTIGLFALVGLPYALKFLWAPVMDRFTLPWLGRRRGWLFVTQAMLILGIVIMAMLGPSQPIWLAAAALAVAFTAASQDIVADAYRTDILKPRQLGAGAAVFVMGYRLAMIASSAGVMMLSGSLGWRLAYGLMAILLGLGMVVTLLAPEPDRRPGSPASMQQAIIQPLARFVQGRSLAMVAVLALFILLFRLPDTLANRMTMPFLISHLQFDVEQVGFVRQLMGLWITILGTLAGGWLVSRMPLKGALVLFGLLQAVSNAGFLALAYTGTDQTMLWIVIATESFCNGLVTAGFLAFLMSQCDPRYSATQYALLTSLMAVTGILAGTATGWLVAQSGYVWFFSVTILLGLPGLLLIPLLPATDQTQDDQAQADSN